MKQKGRNLPFDPISRRVRAALYVAVGSVLDTIPYRKGARGEGAHQFRRLSGHYGAEIRVLATERPELTPQELAALVVAPHEYPDDLEAAEIAERVVQGARDRARRAHPASGVDLSLPIAPDLPKRIEELRQRVQEGKDAQEARPRPIQEPFERTYSVVPRFVYDALRRPPTD